jgi:hypothetical protein
VNLAHRAEEPDRAHDCGRAQEQRQPGRHQRAEGDEQDEEREGQGEVLGLLEVVVQGLAQALRRGGVAELGDRRLGMRALERGGGRERRVDRLLGGVDVARQVEVDEHGAAVLRHVAGVLREQRVLDVADAARLLEARDDVAHDRRVAGVADLQVALALDEDGFTRLLGEVGRVDDAVAALRLAVAHVGVGQRLLPDRAPDEGGEDHEQEPSGDRFLAVPRAPATGARGETAAVHFGELLRGERRDCTASPASHDAPGAPMRVPTPALVGISPPPGEDDSWRSSYKRMISRMMMMMRVPMPMYMSVHVPERTRRQSHADGPSSPLSGCHTVPRTGA